MIGAGWTTLSWWLPRSRSPCWSWASSCSGARLFGKRAELDVLAAELRPSLLAEVPLFLGIPADLHARAIVGAHKLWLASEVTSPDGRWSAVVTITQHVAPSEAAYREAVATIEERFTVGYDGEGGITSPKATGGLCFPEGIGRQTLQLMPLGAVAPGSELRARVTLAALTGAQTATFRVFVGVSVR